MADWYGKRVDEEFQEEDVWGGVVNEREDSSPQTIKNSQKAHRRQNSSGSTCSSAWSFNGGSRMNIPRSQEAKLVVPHQQQQSSAPVKVPDGSKIYGRGKSNMSWVGHEDIGSYQECVHDDDDDDDDDDDEIVPPHEYIARRMARTQISSFSMCEGVGRTLKGRDLSRLRNAILTKTGFLE